MKKTIMQITDYSIKGLEKQVGHRVGIDDLSIMNEVDELDVCSVCGQWHIGHFHKKK